MNQAWIRMMIGGIVGSTAVLAISWFSGCAFGFFKTDQCLNSTDKSLAILAGLLTTVTSLAVRLDSDADHSRRRSSEVEHVEPVALVEPPVLLVPMPPRGADSPMNPD